MPLWLVGSVTVQTDGAASFQVNPVDRRKVTACSSKFIVLVHIALWIHHQISQMSVKRFCTSFSFPAFDISVVAQGLIVLVLHSPLS